MTLIAETPRLRIRRFSERDAEFILQLLNSAGWLEFIGDRNIHSLEDARLYLVNGPLFSYHQFGFGPYLVELKDTHTPIGMCSLIKRDELEHVDLGFAFLPGHLRKAYAWEASQAIMQHAKEALNIDRLVAITDRTNKASISLLEKLGFSSAGTIRLKHEEEELLYFTYTA